MCKNLLFPLNVEELWGLSTHTFVVLGFPSSSKIIIFGVLDSIFKSLPLALGDRKKPTPPTVALTLFFVAEYVTSSNRQSGI